MWIKKKEYEKLKELTYKYPEVEERAYKELHKKQQLLNNNLTQEVHELKKEIKKLKGLRTYSTMNGEYEAHSVRIDGDFLEFIRDGEVIARVKDTAYEVVE